MYNIYKLIIGLDMIGLEMIGLDMIKLDMIGLEVIGLGIIGLEMIGSILKHMLTWCIKFKTFKIYFVKNSLMKKP